MSPSRGRSRVLLAVATVGVLHLVMYQATAPLRLAARLDSPSPHLAKRATNDEMDSTDALIDWLALYRHCAPEHRPVVLVAMAVWLVFLFAFVGICASEFFCPNLSHIASRLGLSESVAGVTFLAFSNGSPDVFSTFSALNANAGSLAIGELIGAASFIVSVVAGTMALISPFRVARHTFLRDVGFFTLATLLTLAILYDSHIHLWEALTMVALYVVYVLYVALGGWYHARREDRHNRLRDARNEYDHRERHLGALDLDLEQDELDEQDAGRFEGGAEIEWERDSHDDDDDEDEDDDVIDLAISGTTTPRSTTGRSITSAFSSDSIIYHPSTSQHHRRAAARGSITPPVRPPVVSPRLPRHSHSHAHAHYRSRSTSLVNPPSSSSRPPPTPLLSNSISSLSTTPTGTLAAAGAGSSSSRKSPNPRAAAARPSLLGAIEFRDLVNSLHQDRDSAHHALSVFGGTGTTAEGPGASRKRSGSGKRPGHSRTNTNASLTTTMSSTTSPALSARDDDAAADATEWNWNGWPGVGTAAAAATTTAGRRRASSSPGFRPLAGAPRLDGDDDALADGILGAKRASGSDAGDDDAAENPWIRGQEEEGEAARARAVKKVPSILLTSTNGSDTLIPTTTASSTEPDDAATVRPRATATAISTRQRRGILARAVLAALFPSLSQFGSKSVVGKLTALMCVPALLVLNLTLPVAEEVHDDDSACGIWDEREDEEKEDDAVAGGVPKGIRLPDDDDDDGTMLADPGEASERVGKRLHSPAIAHPHHHAHSHHLSTAATAAVDDLPRMLELGLDEDPAVPSSPWVDQASNPPPRAPASHHFRIASTESDDTVNRVHSSSESSTATATAAHDPNRSGQGDRTDDDDETESILLEKLECDAARRVTRGLTSVQCTLGPVFCACALFADELRWYQPALALAVGAVFATLAWRFFHHPRHPGRVTLCFVGFAIAMVWILMIVNEVVGVLQTLGHLFGISDAILGLTIFAMGNSLGDLVANATVARMGYPSMAIAACFGGPMLNILLGVGLSGTYLIARSPTHEPIHVEMGRTLLVSGVGLFAILVGSLVVVPLNGYRMTKRIGAILIAAYTVVLSINVAAEIWL
ncbi:hypothetical protein JCM11491_004304 [Sporobolomyces phaffii]